MHVPTLRHAWVAGAVALAVAAITLPGDSAHAASRRYSAVGNCELQTLGGVSDSGINVTDAASGYPAFNQKVLVGAGDDALCTVPSDTTLRHDDVAQVNVHLNYGEPDCTGTHPNVYFGVLSYTTGSYAELPASKSVSGCNFTFSGNSGIQLAGWWTHPSWFPMVRVAAAAGEPMYIRGFWMQD